MSYESYIFQKVEPRTHMLRGKIEALSVSNEEVEIYVIDEDNVSQDIRVDFETLRGELLKKIKDAAIFNAEELEKIYVQIIPFQIEATLNGSDVQIFALI